MARANLTLQMEAETIRQARIVAARRGTSVSALAARGLEELVEEDDRREMARARAEAILAQASGRGGRNWTRDDLHDRDSRSRR